MIDNIPFVNLERQIEHLKPALMDAIEAVLNERSFILGAHVKAFETDYANALGVRHGIGCSDGTSALSLAMEALGIGDGDEIITVPHTFIATVEAIHHVGATPVFIDIDPDTYNMDVAAVEAAITARTKALLPVHIYGMPCNMDSLVGLTKSHGLKLIEDAAQAHLATYNKQCVGTFGDAGTFSFYPGKNLGAIGDAGFVTVRDDDVADRIFRLRNHGRTKKYEHDMIGYNRRMDGIQAAVLSVKLGYLKTWTQNRRVAAAHYTERLTGHGFQLQKTPAGADSVYHLFTVQVSNRDKVMEHLQENSVGCGIHYPVPLHLQPAFATPKAAVFPVAESVSKRILSLPICGEITQDEVDRVCDVFLTTAKP